MRFEVAPTRWPRVGAAPAGALALVLLCVALIQELGSADLCHVHRLTGWPCPTCGSTRLVLALSRGEWSEALALNPLVFLAFAAALSLLLLRVLARRRLVLLTTKRRAQFAPWVLLGLLAANWIYVAATLPPSPASRHAAPPSGAAGAPR